MRNLPQALLLLNNLRIKMATCPHCNAPLSDDWLKRNAASLMGKVGGKSKARTNAKQAARARWDRVKRKGSSATPTN
jgi:hypothetical protein